MKHCDWYWNYARAGRNLKMRGCYNRANHLIRFNGKNQRVCDRHFALFVRGIVDCAQYVKPEKLSSTIKLQ